MGRGRNLPILTLSDEDRETLPAEKQIRRGCFRSTHQLKAVIRQYLAHHNTPPKSFRWPKSADGILTALAKYCERTPD